MDTAKSFVHGGFDRQAAVAANGFDVLPMLDLGENVFRRGAIHSNWWPPTFMNWSGLIPIHNSQLRLKDQIRHRMPARSFLGILTQQVLVSGN